MEIFERLLALTFWEKFSDFHGLLAMTSLILFGAGIVLYFIVKKDKTFVSWLKKALLALFVNLLLLDIAGLSIYARYRASGGPRTILKADENTKWLHSIVFEHKEFLAFAPVIMIIGAFIVTKALGDRINDKKYEKLRRSIIFSLVLSLIYVLLVASEAVLVAKTAPVK